MNAPLLREVEGGEGFGAEGVDVAVGGLVVGGVGMFHPVDHVGSVAVEAFGLEAVEGAGEGGTEVPVCALLGLEAEVPLQAGAVVVEVGVGGGAKALVEGGKELQRFSGSPGEVDAGIEPHGAFDGGVVVGQHADGEGHVVEDDVVLDVEAEVGSSVLVLIIGVVAWHFVALLVLGRDFLAETSGEDVLAPEFEADGGLAECPGGVGVGVGAIDVGLVEVLEVLVGLGIGSSPDVVVEGAVPVELDGHMDVSLVLGLEGNQIAAVFLILRVGACAVEGVGAIVHGAESCLQVGVEVLALVASVPVGVALVEVVVVGATVAAGVASADAVVEVSSFQCPESIGTEGSVGASLQMGTQRIAVFGASDDVDGSSEGLASVDSAGSSFDDFDALDVIDVDGEIDGQMAGVGIGDVDAVEQDGELILGSAVHADVGLNAEASTLPDVHSCGEFQQVVDGLGTGGFDILTVDDLDEADGLVGRKWGTGGDHLHGDEEEGVEGIVGAICATATCGAGGLSVVVALRTHSHHGCSRIGTGESEGGNAEDSDADFAFQTEEDCIAVTGEVVPDDGLWFLVEYLFHCFLNFELFIVSSGFSPHPSSAE